MRKVNAIIEQASGGTYSIYMDADDMDYLVTGTGKTKEEAIQCFKNGYEATKALFASEGKDFEEVEFNFVDTTSLTREEQINKAAKKEVRYVYTYTFQDIDDLDELYKKGVKWADEHPKKGLVDIEKVCEWLKENAYFYVNDYTGSLNEDSLIQELCKAFEKNV